MSHGGTYYSLLRITRLMYCSIQCKLTENRSHLIRRREDLEEVLYAIRQVCAWNDGLSKAKRSAYVYQPCLSNNNPLVLFLLFIYILASGYRYSRSPFLSFTEEISEKLCQESFNNRIVCTTRTQE